MLIESNRESSGGVSVINDAWEVIDLGLDRGGEDFQSASGSDESVDTMSLSSEKEEPQLDDDLLFAGARGADSKVGVDDVDENLFVKRFLLERVPSAIE